MAAAGGGGGESSPAACSSNPPSPADPPAAADAPSPASQPSSQHVVAWEACVAPDAAGQQLQELLQALQPLRFASKSAAKKAVRRGRILVDGAPATNPSQLLSGGQQLRCLERAADAAAHDAERNARTMAAAAQHLNLCRPELALVVVYEDDHLAAVVKPQGVPCDTPPGRGQQPAAGTSGAAEEGGTSGGQQGPRPALPSVYTLLAHTLAPSRAPGALRRPRHVHRLDEPTGGLLLAAKSHRAQQELGAAFEERRVTKRYRALAWGRLEGRGLVTYPLDGRHCETEYAAVAHTRVDPAALGLAASSSGSSSACGGSAGQQPEAVWVTTLDMWPHTGRTRQLRRHAALLGHPLVGEPRFSFGYAAQRLASGQAMDPNDHRKLPAGAGDAAAAAAAAAAGQGEAAPAAQPAPPEALAAAVPAPPPQDDPLLREAAAVASQRHTFKLCLWAVELRLERGHPITAEPLHVLIAEPPLYASVRAALGGGAAPA